MHAHTHTTSKHASYYVRVIFLLTHQQREKRIPSTVCFILPACCRTVSLPCRASGQPLSRLIQGMLAKKNNCCSVMQCTDGQTNTHWRTSTFRSFRPKPAGSHTTNAHTSARTHRRNTREHTNNLPLLAISIRSAWAFPSPLKHSQLSLRLML